MSKDIRIRIEDDVIEIAARKARESGVTCVGTKIRFDIERYYRNLAYRERRKHNKGDRQ